MTGPNGWPDPPWFLRAMPAVGVCYRCGLAGGCNCAAQAPALPSQETPMPSDPTGWPSVCKCGATAVSPCNRSPCFRGERDPGRIYNEAEIAAALAQARRDALEEAGQIVREHEAHIPTLKARDYPDDMGRLIDDIEAAIRAKAQEEPPS
jgi:hypothetical protein